MNQKMPLRRFDEFFLKTKFTIDMHEKTVQPFGRTDFDFGGGELG